MKSIQGHEVYMLIDTRATDNFIRQDVAHELDVPLEDTVLYVIHKGEIVDALQVYISFAEWAYSYKDTK